MKKQERFNLLLSFIITTMSFLVILILLSQNVRITDILILFSLFQTIVDSSSNTSSILSSSRDSVVCKGLLEQNNNLKAVYIPTDATVAGGDSVETSGLGGIYPKGIYIGKVSKVVNTTNLNDRYAIIETGVNFNKLETVLVITN